jgi:hypothetical protein
VNARRLITVVVVLGLLTGFGYWLGQRDRLPSPSLPRLGPDCTVEADGRVRLETDQVANAATITAVGVRLEMPDRAVVVALATALQESELRNLPHLGDNNDHDSVGLFQQRPSQGWGSEEQLSDPGFAAERFYQALRRVDGWQEMRVTEAAQRVQRSAYPEAYQQWAGDAEVLATALLGRAAAAVGCADTDDGDGVGDPELLAQALRLDWGDRVEVSPADPGGVTVHADNRRAGWRYAHWLVAHAAGHSVARIRFADRQWTAESGNWAPAGGVVDRVEAFVTS